MPHALATSDAFTTTTAEDGFHYVVNMATGELLPKAYPLRKTANRAARVMSERAAEDHASRFGPIAEPDEPATSSPLLNDRPVTFSDDAPVYFEGLYVEPPTLAAQIDVEDIAPTGQVEPKAPVIRHAVATTIATREDWLNAASVMIGSILSDRADLELPSYRVTCGWPSKGGTKASKRTLGECWNPEASDDAHAEVFISPMEVEPITVVAILAHELIHACLPKGTGHKGPFVKAAKAIGFLAPFTQLKMGDDLIVWAGEVVAALPAYPHGAINPAGSEGEKKTQTTRMIKAVCMADEGGCGYQVRLTRKWIDAVGAPICPQHMEAMTCEGLEPSEGDEPEGGDE
jgi:hypothetical protein